LNMPLSVPELLEAAKRISPTWVIAPDFRKDAERTLIAYRDMKRLNKGAAEKIGVALQGADVTEIVLLFSAVRDTSLLCFPYKEDRMLWMRTLLEKHPPHLHSWPQYLHLFGMSTYEDLAWWSEIARLYGQYFQISVDTAKPIKWGVERKRMAFELSPRHSHVASATIHQLKDLDEKQLSAIFYNIAYLRNFTA
jgi:hypothetical protein